jgi:hypothetical protein
MRQSVKLCSLHGRAMHYGICSACDSEKQVRDLQANCKHNERTLISSAMNKANRPFEECVRCKLGFPVGEIKTGFVESF